MRKTICLSLVIFTVLIGTASAKDQAAWYRCQSNDECVVVGTGCAVSAVHKDYQGVADAYYRTIDARMDRDCEVTYNNKSAVQTACVTKKTSCKNFFGKVDPASTCLSKDKTCTLLVPQPAQTPVAAPAPVMEDSSGRRAVPSPQYTPAGPPSAPPAPRLP